MNPVKNAIGHLISCKDASRLVSQMQERPLTAWQRIRLRWHLAVCRMCRTFENQMGFLRKAMERYRE